MSRLSSMAAGSATERRRRWCRRARWRGRGPSVPSPSRSLPKPWPPLGLYPGRTQCSRRRRPSASPKGRRRGCIWRRMSCTVRHPDPRSGRTDRRPYWQRRMSQCPRACNGLRRSSPRQRLCNAPHRNSPRHRPCSAPPRSSQRHRLRRVPHRNSPHHRPRRTPHRNSPHRPRISRHRNRNFAPPRRQPNRRPRIGKSARANVNRGL